MGDHSLLERLQKGEEIPLANFTDKYDPVTRLILENGGILPFAKKLQDGKVSLPALSHDWKPMTMAEKIIAKKLIGGGSRDCFVSPGDAVLATVDGGYSHEYTTAQVHSFLAAEYGKDYKIPDPSKFAVFEDHLLYATGVPRYGPFVSKIETLRELQKSFQKHTGVRDLSLIHI